MRSILVARVDQIRERVEVCEPKVDQRHRYVPLFDNDSLPPRGGDHK